jgi:hypothetical protein
MLRYDTKRQVDELIDAASGKRYDETGQNNDCTQVNPNQSEL